jgi:hypothetical protein
VIHILFSAAAGTLRQVLGDRGKGERVAHFTDALDWGPISSVDFEDRETWLNVNAPTDLGPIDWLVDSASQFRAIVSSDPDRLIWLSPRSATELSGLHWFLNEFGASNAQFIIADYPLRGTWRDAPPLKLSELQHHQIAELLDKCPRTAWNPSRFPESDWRTLMAEGALLRVADGGRLKSAPVDYFDHFLLSRCTIEWAKAHRVIADTMGDMWDAGHDPDVAMLFWRLRELILHRQIAHEGEMPLFGTGSRHAAKVRRS